jgi:hypothetical protein
VSTMSTTTSRSRLLGSRGSCYVLLALAVAGANMAPAHSQTNTAKCRLEDFEQYLEVIRPPVENLTLKVTPNRTTWRLGEKARFEVTSKVGGRLLLMSVDSAGLVFPIFPNPDLQPGETGIIEPGDTITVPGDGAGYEIDAQPPLGASRIIAIVRPIDRPIRLDCLQALESGQSVSLTQGPSAAPGALGAPPAGPREWGVAEFRFTVTR